MIPVVEQDGAFGRVVGLLLEVIDVVRQQLNQALVSRDIGFGTVDEEGEAQAIDSQRSLDTIGRFVETKPFRCHTGITGILHRL